MKLFILYSNITEMSRYNSNILEIKVYKFFIEFMSILYNFIEINDFIIQKS